MPKETNNVTQSLRLYHEFLGDNITINVNNINADNILPNIDIINDYNLHINDICTDNLNILNCYNIYREDINNINFNNIIQNIGPLHLNVNIDAVNNIDHRVEEVAVIYNQTVHDQTTESSIQASIIKLRNRYKDSETLYTSLEQIIVYLQQKADNLVSLKKLTPDLRKVIEAHFNNLLLLRTRSEDYSENYLIDLLRLAILALEDQAVAQQMCGHNSSLTGQLADDMHDRWAGWFKSAIVDSQLAYRLDRGDSSIPDDAQLNQDISCFLGSCNRIIAALNLIHPDVTIQEGQLSLANMERYCHDRKIARIKEFGQNKLQTTANQYLSTIALKNLKEILLELEKINKEELDLEQKNEALIFFEGNLKEYIVRDASLSLQIEDITLIENELSSFIFAYIDGVLLIKVKETIVEKESDANYHQLRCNF